MTLAAFDCYVGVRPCGCKTAWVSIEHSTEDELGEFFRWMKATRRDVLPARTDDVRGQLAKCPHVDPWSEHDGTGGLA